MNADMFKSGQAKPDPPSIAKRFMRTLGLTVKARVTVFNRSDTMAYIMISDTPMHHMTGAGAGVAGGEVSINRELIGEYKNQSTFLAPGGQREFEVFTHKIYYSVYFKLNDGTEKLHTRDRLHNALKKDINILPRHVEEAQYCPIPSM